MTTSDPTAPDAVAMLQWMHACVVHSENHGDVPRIGSDEVLAVLRATQDERARHAEEVARLRDVHLDETRALDDLRLKEIASLRDQLRRTEGLIGSDAVRRINDLEIQLCTVRDQLDDAHIELAARRSLDADVRACAEYCRNILIGPPPLAPVALAARRILAALDSHECPECHMPGHHKMSCSRGGSKGGRFSVRLDSQGGEGE